LFISFFLDLTLPHHISAWSFLLTGFLDAHIDLK